MSTTESPDASLLPKGDEDVFISYARVDQKVVRRLQQALNERGRDTWVDWTGIPPAGDWLETIKEGIDRAQVFVFVLSSQSLKSPIAMAEELRHAQESRKRIIPIVIEDCEDTDVPEDHKAIFAKLKRLNYIFLRESDHFATGVAKVLEALDTDLEHVREHTEYLRLARVWQQTRLSARLLRGKVLKRAERWLTGIGDRQPPASELQIEFIRASRKAENRRNRGLIVALLLGLVFVAVAAMIAVWQSRVAKAQAKVAKEQEHQAKVQEKKALKQLYRAEVLRYAGQIDSAQREWEVGNSKEALQFLNATRWDFRGWEHDYLYKKFGQNQGNLRGHSNRGIDTALRPDVKRIVSDTEGNNTVKVQYIQSGVQILTLKGHSSPVHSVWFSPDCKRVVSGSGDELKVWDAETRQEILTLKGFSENVTMVCFSPDGERIVSGSEEGTVKMWNAQTGHEMLTLESPFSFLWSMCFSPNGKHVVCSGYTGRINPGEASVIDAETGKEVITVVEDEFKHIRSVCFSPDSKRIVTGTVAGTMRVWDAETGQKIFTLGGHSGKVTSVCFSPNGKQIASGGDDNKVTVWNAETGQEMITLKGHSEGVISVCFSPCGKRIVSASDDNTVKVWEAETGYQMISFEGHSATVRSVNFSPDGKRIVGGLVDHTVVVWEAGTSPQCLTFNGHKNAVISVAISPDGKRIVSGDQGGEWHTTAELIVWGAETGQELVGLKGHRGDVTSVCFSPDGKRVVSSHKGEFIFAGVEGQAHEYGPGELKLWDAESGEELMTIKGDTDRFASVCFSPDGESIVGSSVGWKGTLKKWDAKTGQEKLTLDGKPGPSMCFSPDGKRIASGGTVWNAETGRVMLSLEGYSGSITSMCFSPDGKRIASGGTVWNAETGRVMFSLEGYSGSITSMCFSPNGKLVVSGHTSNGRWEKPVKPGKLKIWDAETGREMVTFEGHSEGINSVCFSPDGKRIFSGSDDGTVKVWDASHSAPD